MSRGRNRCAVCSCREILSKGSARGERGSLCACSASLEGERKEVRVKVVRPLEGLG